MNRRRWFLSVIALTTGGWARLGAKEGLVIVPLVSDDDVLVSFELTDAYTPEVREAIASGLRTTFAYDVALRMKAPGWLDRTIVTAVISTTDQYDNLTRRHVLARTVDGHLEDTLVTEDDAVVGRWLTKFTRLPVCKTSKLEPGGEYYLRISARSRPRGDSFLGWASAITSQAKFTFIR